MQCNAITFHILRIPEGTSVSIYQQKFNYLYWNGTLCFSIVCVLGNVELSNVGVCVFRWHHTIAQHEYLNWPQVVSSCRNSVEHFGASKRKYYYTGQ